MQDLEVPKRAATGKQHLRVAAMFILLALLPVSLGGGRGLLVFELGGGMNTGGGGSGAEDLLVGIGRSSLGRGLPCVGVSSGITRVDLGEGEGGMRSTPEALGSCAMQAGHWELQLDSRLRGITHLILSPHGGESEERKEWGACR
ncbi:hypothetical protein C8J57DRAFT_1232561 [Mycena rebaudengoi]|nr:hypothetical protein C8J57DRAFT_1232561 [Mycena rebaudengoi]